MKIAYIASSIIPSRTANSVHVMLMCEVFTKLGHEVMLIVPKDDENELKEVKDIWKYYGVCSRFDLRKIKIIQRLGGSIRKLSYAWGFKYRLKKFKPDLAYGRDYKACATAVSLGIPTCYEMHAPMAERLQNKEECQSFFASDLLKRVVVISDACRKLVIEQKAAPAASKIVVAPDGANPVDRSSFVGACELNGREGALQVGYAGSLYPGRGIDLIIEVAGRLPEMDFHIMGGSSNEIAKWKADGVTSNINFHGHVPAAKIAGYRDSCDVLLAPYQQKVGIYGGSGETSAFMSPLKVFEYMASGKLMIVSDMPVLREVLDDSFCMLLSPTDVDAWCEALKRGADSELRKEYGQKALEVFMEKYTWLARAESVLKGIFD